MNVSPQIQKIIVIILILSALGFVVYNTIFGEVPLPELSEEGVPLVETVGQDILTLADKLNSTEIDTKIFSDPLFQSLIDISIPLTPESQGRENPFAQIDSNSTQRSTRTP